MCVFRITDWRRKSPVLIFLSSISILWAFISIGLFQGFLFKTFTSPNFHLNSHGHFIPVDQIHSVNDTTNEDVNFRLNKKSDSLAVCIVGGLRSFELNGPTIIRHLLDFYNPRVTFFNVPLDQNTHKITLLLNSSHSIIINIVAQHPMDENEVVKNLLSPIGSPNGVQGILQYFDLVEGCVDLITAYQKTHNVKFDRILRTRADTFWTADPPPLSGFDSGSFFTPHGSQFGGLNDRFAISNFTAGIIGLKRRSLLKRISPAKLKHWNSERSLKAQVEVFKIRSQTSNFPFCILSTRVYPWPLVNRTDIPVLSITSKSKAMNGAKCRPCQPAASGKASEVYLRKLRPSRTGLGSITGVELCDASEPWAKGWEAIFDEFVGTRSAEVRAHFLSQDYRTCEEVNALLQQRVELYAGPPASVLCVLASWGSHESVGPPNQEWHILPKGLSASSVVYSLANDKSLAWEKAMEDRFGCLVRSFRCLTSVNPSPGLITKAHGSKSKDFRFNSMEAFGWCFGSLEVDDRTKSDGLAKANEGHRNLLLHNKPLQLHSREGLNREAADLVRINVSEQFLGVCLEGWIKPDFIMPTCQLIVRFVFNKDQREKRRDCVLILRERGLHLTKCFGVYGFEKCHFLSDRYCDIR